jgi:hypothetical protein
MHCPSSANFTSCYYFNTSLDSYANHKSNCARMGGYLVAYNTADEQLEVENAFPSVRSGYTWIGLERSGNLWYWLDGRS